MGLTVVAVVGLEEFEADELALGACNGLGGQAGEACDGLHPLLDLPEEFQRALGIFDGDLRVQSGEARQASGPVVDVWVILHRARTEREAAGIGRDVKFA